MPEARFVGTTWRKQPPESSEPSRVPRVVVAFHPRLARVGDGIALDLDRAVEIGRLQPEFGDGPLDDPFISRSTFAIKLTADGVEIHNPDNVDVRIAGAIVRGVHRADIGVDVVVGDRIVLRVDDDCDPVDDDLGLIGRSGVMRALRAEIRRVAREQMPVLIRGETGTGKELVARAIHASGPRAKGPFIAVNLAAIPPTLGASELFGHDKGAFSGAGEARRGCFERAAGGVLFLDELGDLDDAVQPMLLRALDTGELQPLGSTTVRHSDAQVIAATDADLDDRVATGQFRAALFHRLAGGDLRTPPLRERGLDVALLFARFAGDRDDTLQSVAWLPGSLAAELFRAAFPGNVRQLRAVVRHLAGLPKVDRSVVEPLLEPRAATAAPDVIDDTRLRDTLRAHRFEPGASADALGISRPALYRLMVRASIRTASDLSADEIELARRTTNGGLDAMAETLEVSARGLRLRMTQLGLD
ncbi:MAG TPA: sigma 54-interacting transcriptional regulator [Kofleriaceae bacterium]|jgi:two-component system nitrogen regulation response regulator GlnG|nr:sigma 54-interacting transcriptional regulator [Kofleriaceae bacterium]